MMMKVVASPRIDMYMQRLGDVGIDLFWVMTVGGVGATTERNFNALERRANFGRRAIIKQIRMKKLGAGLFKHMTVRNRDYRPPNMYETATIRLNGRGSDNEVETDILEGICEDLGFESRHLPARAAADKELDMREKTIAEALEEVAKVLTSDVKDMEEVEPVGSTPKKTPQKTIASRLVHIAEGLVAEEDDPMARERVSKMWIELHKWTNKEMESRPASAPIVTQLLELRAKFDKRLRGKMGLSGRPAVEAVIEAMAGLYTVDAPPLKRLWRKYDDVEDILRANGLR